MKLRISSINCDDLEPSNSGHPESDDDFDLLFEVDLYEENKETNCMYFEFTVASPKALARRETGSFMPPTLVLETFSWSRIAQHIEKLLMYVHSCDSWECVAFHFAGLMRPASPSAYNWRF